MIGGWACEGEEGDGDGGEVMDDDDIGGEGGGAEEGVGVERAVESIGRIFGSSFW